MSRAIEPEETPRDLLVALIIVVLAIVLFGVLLGIVALFVGVLDIWVIALVALVECLGITAIARRRANARRPESAAN